MHNKLIAEIKKRGVPAIDTQDIYRDPTIYIELSLFNFPWRWYVCEYAPVNGGDMLFFGFVKAFRNEWRYFCLSDLVETCQPIIINYDFKPLVFSELEKKYDL